MMNPIGDTLFVSAAVQNIGIRVHSGTTLPSGPVLVGQPCIRTNYLGRAGAEEGISTSFVNMGSLHARSSPDDFIRHLEFWLDTFSALGIHAGDITLLWEDRFWRKGPYLGHCLAINYMGVELGEGIVIGSAAGPHGLATPTLDFGFGLERIVWVMNRTPSYFTVLLPLSLSAATDPVLLDLVRTATLITMSGVAAASRGYGLRLRRLLRVVARDFPGAPTDVLVSAAYRHWSAFIRAQPSVTDCITAIRAEIEWARVLWAADLAGRRPPKSPCTLESLADQLLLEGMPIDAVTAILQTMNSPQCPRELEIVRHAN